MSLTILAIDHFDFTTKSGFILNFKASTDKEFFNAQEIFRAIISTNSIESKFGYDENFDEILAFEYPKNKKISLKFTTYLNKNKSEIEVFWKKEKIKNIA